MRRASQLLHINEDKLWFSATVCLIVLFLAVIHGLLPGTLSSDGGALAARFTTYGAIECASHSLDDLLKLKCSSLGSDTVAFRSPTDSPFIFMAGLMLMITHLSVEYAFNLVAIGILVLAVIGAYLLNRRFGIRKYVALTLAAAYLMMPIVLSMQAFGGTYWGIMLLPATIFFTLWSWDSLTKTRQWWQYLLLTCAWIFVSTFMLFMDGYAFFMNASAAIILWIVWSWRKWRKLYVWLGLAMFTVGHILAYLAYVRVFSDAGAGSNMTVFRAMGLDLITLVTPSSGLWWPSLLGVDNEGVLRDLWGDGSNAAFNFTGFIMAALACVTIFYIVKDKKAGRLTVGLLLIGVAAFVMSLGPVLKINTERELVSGSTISQSYNMPEEDGVVPLPTSILYEEIPGLSSMRATYRWHVVTVLCVIILAGLAISRVSKKHAKIAASLLVIACIEVMPNPFRTIEVNTVTASQITQFDTQVTAPLKQQLNSDDKILYFPNAGNDYLANYLTPMTGVRSYNLGNDKGVARASTTWPAEVRQLLLGGADTLSAKEQAKLLDDILQNKQASAVVIPYFDLRWDSYSWPPRTDTALKKAEVLLRNIEQNSEMHIVKDKYFSIVRLKG